MLSIILWLGIGGWIGWGYLQDWQSYRREDERRAERAARQQRVVAVAPDSPAAYERLGDMLRETDDPAGAVEAYEKAIALSSTSVEGTGAGWMPGGGIETKIRLARLDVAERADPARHGQAMRTRQQVCRTCGLLGAPTDTKCANCDAPLPVDTMLDAWRNDVMRSEIAAEAVQVVLKLAIVGVALLFASWMPWEVRGTIAIAAVIVIPFRLLKRFGEG